MDRLDAMHLFIRVAELGSFSAVAQQLGVARSVVTRQIAALEAHLGVKLMARSTRRLALTSAGTAYLEKCRVILNLVEAAETGVAEERLTPRGNIRISLPLSFGLKRVAPLLLDFAARYPDSGIEESYGPEQWPARCIDYWTYLDRPGHARLCYEGWGFSDELVPLTGDPDADAAALAAAWARILRVDQMPA